MTRGTEGKEPTSSLGSPGNAHIHVDSLDSTSSSLSKLLLGLSNELGAVGADEATRVGKLSLIVVLELLHHTHLLKDMNGRGANSIATVLVTGELLLVEESNLDEVGRHRSTKESP
jgi:hypothetical protein